MAKLDNWAVVFEDPYLPPERQTKHLCGVVTGHPNPRHEDGKEIVTSTIKAVSGRVVTTMSGTTYELGEANPQYQSFMEEWARRTGKSIDPEEPIKMFTYGVH